MKYSTFLLATIIFLALASCKKQLVQLNDNYIPVNKCRSFSKGGYILTCCLDSVIQDSRCPINALCIWQGIAVARFKVNSQNTDHIIELSTTKFEPYSEDTTIAGFKIELISLLPQRESGKPFNYNEYVAEVKITKL